MVPCTLSRCLRVRVLSAAFTVAVTLFATAAPASGARHVVRAGDTLVGIAVTYGTSVRAITAANGLANPNWIVAGQVLEIPTDTAAGGSVATVHRVTAGETLFDIAHRYGVTAATVAVANEIATPDLLRVGQRLTIPSGGSAPAGGASGDDSGDGSMATHAVKAGETLASIAARHGVTAKALAAANALTNPNLVRIGQVLVIPAAVGGAGGGGGTSAYEATGGGDGRTVVPGAHTVDWGERLDDIAQEHGVSVEDLAAANGLLPPYNLYAGSSLYLSAPNRLPTNLAVCPVAGAAFANDWRFPRPGGRAHAGNDLLAPTGTPVLAPVDGEVTYLTGPVGGRQFELWGDDDILYIGAHLDDFGATGRVEAGDTIGYVGTTGNAVNRPHLHFEVHPDDGPAMNPYPLLRAACR